MGNDTRPSRRVKDDESSNSKGKQLSASSSAAVSETSGLRRSSRGTAAKKAMAPSSPSVSVRKSERLEKKSPKTPPLALRKSERVEKKCSPSPLQKSAKGKATLSTPAATKKSNQNPISSSIKQRKCKKEKSVKELTMETEEVVRSQKSAGSKLKKKRLDSRSYRKIFKKHRNKVKASDHREKQEREDKSSEGDSNNCRGDGDGIDEGSEGRVVKLVDDDETRENVDDDETRENVDDDETKENADDEPEIIAESFAEVEKVKESELVNSQCSGMTTEYRRGVQSGQDVEPSSRKRIRLDGECDGLVTSTSKKVHTSIADTTSLTKDRGEHEVSTTMELAEKSDNHLQQKESPIDLEADGDQYICFTCKLGGKLLCCEGRGCKRSYHLSCLDPPMDDLPLGAWYCLRCVKKKLESGVHSVSKGAESIWNVKEVEVLDVDGLRKEREFLVKYKGLAHIHNCWVLESKLLLEAPSLVAKFNRKTQVTRWKEEWTLPRRVLQRRLLMSPKQRDQYLNEHAGEKLDTHYEWLVKWRGLDYEHVTWELDNASLFTSPDGQGLIKYYENRHSRANGVASSSKADKILESKNGSSVKLPQVRLGISSPPDNNYSDFINKLHDFWLMGKNAVVIDEHVGERFMKAISLIQSFQPNACRPFLIISTSAALYSWDEEFLRLAPEVNVVVYSGNKDLRRSIRKVEFYREGGCLILQVLITTLEIVIEDLDVLRSIEWELLIIDEPQRARISSHSAQIKLLATERRLLLVTGQLKEITSEYFNLLTLLESHSDSPNSESLVTSSSDNIGKLKEKLSKYVVDRCKSDFSRYREYWVPARMSNVQLEQYCAALISNSALLCSPQKQDLAGVLQDLLKSSRKCCDHPYLVDRKIPAWLYKGLEPAEHLGVDIKASGKLHLLDMMLSEIKKRGLRVLILFQDFGGDSIGNILDDFLGQRFGPESFERIVWGLHPTKKQGVLEEFNKKESGRFVLLIETRACLSSIKLSSLDTVIIYGSDWNPANDLRALQRMTLDSQAEQITVFRLYSPYTLEEKVLLLAKQEKNLDCNLLNIGWVSSHLLLMCGACHQFRTLDKFHGDCVTASHADILFKDPSLEDVIPDMLQIISSNGKDTKLRSSSTILNVQQIGGAYRTESSLPGELQSEADEEQPSIFWTKLLEGKHPRWNYIPESSQRNRKKVQHFEIEGTSDEGVRKRRKVVPSLDLGSVGKTISRLKEARGSPADKLPRSLSMSPTCNNERTRANCTSTSQNCSFESEARRELRGDQKSLYLSLKPVILKLCKILKFPANAEGVVEEFLEYVLNNHHVSTESETILQAFQISLCWTVASMLKQKIDHKESLALAKQHLNFKCSKDEADFVYSMLRCLKGMFSYRTGKLKVADSPSSNEQRLLSPLGLPLEIKLVQGGVSKSIEEIQKKFQKKLDKLIHKQQEEKDGIVHSFEEDKARIEERKTMEIAVIRSCFENNASMRVDKLKSVDISIAKEFEELENQMDMRLKKLEAEHLAARKKIQEREAHLVDALKSGYLDELLGKRRSTEPDDYAGEVTLRFPQTNGVIDGANNIASVNVNPPSSEEQIRNVLSVNVSEKDVQFGVPGTLGQENLFSGDEPLLEEQIPDTTEASVPLNEMQLRVPENVSSGGGDAIGSITQTSVAEQIQDADTLTVQGVEDRLSVPVTSSDEVEVSIASEENDETRIATLNGTTGMNQQDTVDNAVVGKSPLPELSQLNGSSVHPTIAMTNGDPVSANQAHEEERTLPSISCGVQLGDVQTCDEQNVTEEAEHLLSQPIETAPSSQSNCEAMVSEPPAQVHLLRSSTVPSSDNAFDVPLVGEVANLPSSEGCTLNPATELVANSPLTLNQAVMQPSTSSPNQTIDVPIGAVGMHFTDLRTSVASELNIRPAQTVPAVLSMPPPLYPDLLQKELERLSKEYDQTCKAFVDKKLHLQSECDKEIAHIRLKYEIKQQEVDAEQLAKKKVFDDNHNKVWMNKILAEAFRFKCMELRSSGRSGVQPDVNVSLMQQLIQLSMQQNARRPSSVAVTSSTSSAAASLQTLAPETNPQTTLPAPIINSGTTPPQSQGVSPPSSLFPSAIARPPQINSLSYSSGNLLGNTQIRVRPPHLRSTAPATSLPPRAHTMSTPPTNPPAPQSNMLPFLPPRLPSSSYQSGPCDGALRPETPSGLPPLPNLISAMEVLRNVDRPPAALLSLADCVPNTGQLNISEFGTSSVPVNPVCTSVSNDVVCLSDDD